MKSEIFEENIRKKHISTLVFEERKIYVYTPPSYSETSKDFPVVYLQDGEDYFNTEKCNLINLLHSAFVEGEMKEIIVVGIEAKNRIDEYSPWYAKALSDKFKDFSGKGRDYLSFIVDNLKPYIDESFNTDAKPNSTSIMGASLGGLISLYAGCLYPHVFGKIGCISGSFWYEGFVEFIDNTDLNKAQLKIYIDVGDLEGIGKNSIQQLMVPNTKLIYNKLIAKGFTGEELKFSLIENAVHNHKDFINRFPRVIKWLFSEDNNI